ncbi:MAG: hypothetical protein DRJ42_21985 [Deltaproteobacteria bacterium]|nr:MAG: hypothetical protein DRJ42_21985 [Deltaproteobacteria bacterium]
MKRALPLALIFFVGCGTATPPPVTPASESPGATAEQSVEPVDEEPYIDPDGWDGVLQREVERRAFADPASVTELLDAPLRDLGLGFSEPFMNESGDVASDVTCRAYPDLSAAGYYIHVPAVDDIVPLQVDRLCTGLHLAERVRRPHLHSALDGFEVARDGRQWLPLDLVRRVFGGEGEAPLSGTLAAEYPASTEGPARSASQLEICPPGETEYDRTCLWFEEMARGDFDHDGREDLALHVTSQSGGASVALFFGVFVLSRRGVDQPLSIVDVALVGIPGGS